MKDFLGNEIKPGDTIVYAGRRGSSLWLTEATVLTTNARAPRYPGDDANFGIVVRPHVHPTDPTPTQGDKGVRRAVTITNGTTVCVTKAAL